MRSRKLGLAKNQSTETMAEGVIVQFRLTLLLLASFVPQGRFHAEVSMARR
jgi:hypothetical protein